MWLLERSNEWGRPWKVLGGVTEDLTWARPDVDEAYVSWIPLLQASGQWFFVGGDDDLPEVSGTAAAGEDSGYLPTGVWIEVFKRLIEPAEVGVSG